MDQATGDCFELNEVGAAIWKALQEGKPTSAIAAELSAVYGILETAAGADIQALLSDLARHGLIDSGCG